jgi:hypothetical protein
MAPTSLVDVVHDPNTRLGWAVLLVEEHGEDIEDLGGEIYLVPNSDGTHSYRVDYTNETCNCADADYHSGETCKHVFGVGIYLAKRRARSFVCEGCRERTPSREGYEVPADNLTFFEGQRVCEPCAFAHGVA